VVRTCTGDVLVRLCLMFYAICMGVRAELVHGAWAAFPVFLQIELSSLHVGCVRWGHYSDIFLPTWTMQRVLREMRNAYFGSEGL
jgi:hypothetical protein